MARRVTATVRRVRKNIEWVWRRRPLSTPRSREFEIVNLQLSIVNGLEGDDQGLQIDNCKLAIEN